MYVIVEIQGQQFKAEKDKTAYSSLTLTEK